MLRVIGGVRKEAVYQGRAYDGVNRTTYTFTSQPFGAANPTRYVVVALTSIDSLDIITGVTIGGIAATNLSPAYPYILWGAAVPTGDTGTVVVSMSGTGVTMGLNIWSLYGLSDTTPFDADYTSTFSSNPHTATLDIPAGGIVLMHCFEIASGSGSFSWSGGTVTNADEDYDVVIGTIGTAGVSASGLAASTGATLTATESGGRNARFAAASWR